MHTHSVIRVLLFLLGVYGLQACTFSLQNRWDRFASKVAQAPPMTTDIQKKRILGPPSSKSKKTHKGLQIRPGQSWIVAFDMPSSSKRYCRHIQVHLASKQQNKGTYRLWVAPERFGPWFPVGQSNTTKTFNVSGLVAKKARYIRIQALKRTEEAFWLKAIQVRLYAPEWKSLLQRAQHTKTEQEKQLQRQHALQWFQEGRALAEKDQFKDALLKYQQAVPYLTQHAPILYAIASVHFDLQEYFQSVRWYNRAQKWKRPTPFQLEEMGENYIALGAYSKAMEHFHHCIRQAPFYPRCYYHRIRIATLMGKNKGHLFEMYRDQYLLARQRAPIQKRKWTLRQSFVRAYGPRHTPYISRFPEQFTSTKHLRWFGFLLQLYPNDRYGVFQEGKYTLATLRKKEPRSKWQTELYRFVFAEQAGFKSISQQYRKQLRIRTPAQIAQLYAVRGDLARLQGYEKKAIQLYWKGLQKVRSGAPKALLLHRLEQHSAHFKKASSPKK